MFQDFKGGTCAKFKIGCKGTEKKRNMQILKGNKFHLFAYVTKK